MCEEMAALVCYTDLLKSTDYRQKRRTFSYRVCTNRDIDILEDVNHVVMQCPFYINERRRMHESLNALENERAERGMSDSQNFLLP